jgi:hypothetical protein
MSLIDDAVRGMCTGAAAYLTMSLRGPHRSAVRALLLRRSLTEMKPMRANTLVSSEVREAFAPR